MEYNGKYIARRRARFRGLTGEKVNIPYGTELEARAGTIFTSGGVPVCLVGSQNAMDHFSWDGDGRGLDRGRAVDDIRAALEKRDMEHDARWARVWEDPVCAKYRRRDHEDYWLWDVSFYEAPVEDLRHIAALVGVKGAAAWT